MAASTTNHPILASWKISDVLARYPRLLDVLVDLSPAFQALRNPILRRVQTRLVTVAQAARIGGLEPVALVSRLHQEAGLSLPTFLESGPTAGSENPEPYAAEVVEEVDASALLAQGEEPFGAIMAAAHRVQPGQALRVVAGFEPMPLYAVLGKLGFRHAARQIGPDAWEVVFARVSAGEATQHEPSLTSADALHLDVRDLAPPEPMVRILEAAARLEPEQTLVVQHHRRPIYLYSHLDGQGFVHETIELAHGHVELRIRRGAPA